MDTTPLCAFASKFTRSNRIVFGDLRRLQRDVPAPVQAVAAA